MSVVALVPTHNCPVIEQTIMSLFQQTLCPDYIVVILDNPKDPEIGLKLQRCEAQLLQAGYSGLHIMRTQLNPFKKAGALEMAFAHYLALPDVEFIFTMDDDTVLDRDVIRQGQLALQKDPKLGAVCTRAGILPAPKKANAWQKLLWYLQHLEYAGFDAHRVETGTNIKVAHGMGTLYRANALRSVRAKRGSVYRLGNITEDYELSRRLVNLGWGVRANLDMLAWTEVPLSLQALWHQRLRWNRGGVDTLLEMGFVRGTRLEVGGHFLFLLFFFLQVIIGVDVLALLFWSVPFDLPLLSEIALGLYFLNNLYRLSYVQKLSAYDVLVRLLYIPEALYALFLTIVLLVAYVFSFFKISQKW